MACLCLPSSSAHRRAVCFLVCSEDWEACVPSKTESPWVGLGNLQASQAKWWKLWDQLLIENHFLLCATCTLLGCSLLEVGFSGLGCSVQLYYMCLLHFLFLKTVARTSFFHSLCGDGTLNLCLEKHNDVYPVLHAGPATHKSHSVIFCNCLIIQIFILWFCSSSHSGFPLEG